MCFQLFPHNNTHSSTFLHPWWHSCSTFLTQKGVWCTESCTCQNPSVSFTLFRALFLFARGSKWSTLFLKFCFLYNLSKGPSKYPVAYLILFWIAVIYFRILVRSFHFTFCFSLAYIVNDFLALILSSFFNVFQTELAACLIIEKSQLVTWNFALFYLSLNKYRQYWHSHMRQQADSQPDKQ
jgi:hypothetical protein